MSSRSVSFRERFRRSFRSSTSTTSTGTPNKTPQRRGSIFDLLYILRRGSSQKSGSPEKGKNDISEQEAFVTPDGEIEDDRQLSREKLLEKIREKKAVIEKLRCQPWPMRRKRRTLTLAQKYLQRHESKVSKTHLIKEELSKKWKKFKRWLANVSIYLIPWEAKIKAIESHFGSVVSSYFTFLRWLFTVNVIMCFLMVSFIVIPEVLADMFPDEERRNDNDTQSRKHLRAEEISSADHFQDIWDYKGNLTVCPLFYGYYSNKPEILSNFDYQLPLAYFLVNLFTLGYSFFAILRRMAKNARLSKLTSGKTEQYTFAWKLFAGWDYSIGNPETAANTVMANANKVREAIMEVKIKQKEPFAWILFTMRVLANILILSLIAGSVAAVSAVAANYGEKDDPTPFEQNAVGIVVSFVTLVFPNIFELISKALERFHPRTALRLQLGRILALYLLNFATIILSLLNHIRIVTDSLNTTDIPATARSRSVRSLIDIDFGNDTMLNMTALIVSNSTSILPILSNALPALFAAPIPPFVHFLTRISPPIREDFESGNFTWDSMDYMTRTARQTRIWDPRFRTSTSQTRFSRTTTVEPVTGPLLWTTVHPKAGTIGVNDANAYLKENISEWMRNNTNDLETFPPLKHKNATTRVTTDSTGGTGPPGTGQGTGQWTGPGRPMTSTRKPPSTTETLEIKNARQEEQRKTNKEKRMECWETWVGQEIAKLITMDLIMTIASILVIDFFRGLWVRYCNRWWCWNLETIFPEYGEFKVAENVLHIINNQGMIWLGLFFAPMLPVMNIIKLIIIMYIRGWACVTCNIPATQVFRASRSNNFYLLLLLLMLFLCTLPVGYIVASHRPSKVCGPFSSRNPQKPRDHFYHVITDKLRDVPFYDQLENVASPGIIIPILVLLALIIYFLVSLIRGLREANQDLQKQLVHERTEEKRKIYKMAGGGKGHKDGADRHALPETKKVDLTHLPMKEKVRREAWRSKPPLDDDEELIKPDQESDMQTFGSDATSPATPSKSGYPDFPVYPSMGASLSSHFIPSLKSLPEEGAVATSEVDDDDDDKQKLLERRKSDHAPKPQPIVEDDDLSRSTPENGMKDKYQWLPASFQSRPQPTITTPLLSPMMSTPSQTPSASSSRSHSPRLSSVPRFPISTEVTVQLPPPITPISETWTPSSYDNYPTPASPMSAISDLSAKQVADMLSPTKFSPTMFQEFMSTPSKHKPMQALKVVSDTPLPSTEIRPARSKADVLIHMSDTDEKYPSDSGQATMTESGDLQYPRARRIPESDESDMEKFAKSRLKRDPTDFERSDGNGKIGKEKKFPKPLSTNFVPWPSPDSGPKPILKHVGPPGRRGSSPATSPPPTPTGLEKPFAKKRFTLSVSPSRSGPADSASSLPTSDTDLDGSPVGKKRYIIRQTPSPSPKMRRARIEQPMPTKLSVVSEITMLPRLQSMPRSRDQNWDDPKWDNNNKSMPDRPSRAQIPSRAQLAESYSAGMPIQLGNWDASGSGRLSRRDSGSSTNGRSASKSKKRTSKETMI